jgi:DUF1009 family protein
MDIQRIGLIAGSGESPSFIKIRAQALGYSCVTAALREEADPALPGMGAPLAWFAVTDVAGIVRFFKSHGITEAVFAGKVDPRHIYSQKQKLGTALLGLLQRGRDRSAESVIRAAMEYFARQGIEFISPEPFLAAAMCMPGLLARSKPSPAVEADIDWGWERARQLADADVGQSIVVKDKAVVAIEGMEGTDAAIRRGGELAGEGSVVIKRARSNQDPRIDLPAVGLGTIESLVAAKGKALCFEAEKMPFLQRDAAVELADRFGIVVLARS